VQHNKLFDQQVLVAQKANFYPDKQTMFWLLLTSYSVKNVLGVGVYYI